VPILAIGHRACLSNDMKILPEIPISDLLKIAPDGEHFRPLTRSDLVAGEPIFQVRLARDVMEPLEAGQLEADSAQAFLPILRGWATVQIQVMETVTETSHSVQLMDRLPQVRSGRYPIAIDEITSPRVRLLTEGKIAYTYFVSPIEVPCTLCGARLKFWPPDALEEHLARCHPDSKMHSRELMPWRNPLLKKPA